MFQIFKFLVIVPLLLTSMLWAQLSDDASSATGQNYQLRPSDVLRVMVHQEDDLTREVRVSQDYSISLPLIGNVDVRNKSVQSVEDLIRDLYAKDYLQNPQVSVIVLGYSERIVSVIGQVNRPGPVIFPQEKALSLLEAIAQAGGVTRLGNPRKVSLTRLEDGVSKTYVIDVQKIIESAGSAISWPLQVGDVIFVPERLL